jgi:protein SCO1/2
MKTRDVLAWLLALLAVGAIVAGAFFTLAVLRPDGAPFQFDATDVSGVEWGRDFRPTGDDGRPRALADFRGKIVARYCGYTRCPDVCPTTLASPWIRGTTSLRYSRYVRAFDESFLGLYGDRAAIARAAQEFKVEVGEHHSVPVFLLDSEGRVRLVVHPDASAESIARDLRALFPTK